MTLFLGIRNTSSSTLSRNRLLDDVWKQFHLGIRGSPAYPSIVKAKITCWHESDGKYLGYLNDYPDHWTQGEDLDDLKTHLRDLFELFGQESIPGIRKVEELEIA